MVLDDDFSLVVNSFSAISLSIQEDDIPENDETIVVRLRAPTGGALLHPNPFVQVTILANDDVAGLLGFEKTRWGIVGSRMPWKSNFVIGRLMLSSATE